MTQPSETRHTRVPGQQEKNYFDFGRELEPWEKELKAALEALNGGQYLMIGTHFFVPFIHRLLKARTPATQGAVGFVQEVLPEDVRPSCHVCGSAMVRCFGCTSCGAHTLPTPAIQPVTPPCSACESFHQRFHRTPSGCRATVESLGHTTPPDKSANMPYAHAPLLTAEQDSGEHQAEVAQLMTPAEWLRSTYEGVNAEFQLSDRLKITVESVMKEYAKYVRRTSAADSAALPQAIARQIQDETFMLGGCEIVDSPEEWLQKTADLLTTALAPLVAERDALITQLAECYRLSGADPDGNEDWRLAPKAVQEVKRLRDEMDDSERADAEVQEIVSKYQADAEAAEKLLTRVHTELCYIRSAETLELCHTSELDELIELTGAARQGKEA